jgi:transcriptional regulator with XRE-family HTH domain
MSDTALRRLARSRARDLRRSVGSQLLDLREERELSQREVAAATGIDRSYLARAEAGEANLTADAIAALATALGAEASLRLYPATGPRLRDHIQVQLLETLLAGLHPRWQVRLEVPVYRPVRGVVDLVLAEPVVGEIVGGEAHSEIRRAERQLRWAAEKTDALPSATGWPWMEGEPRVGRLLILRSTASTRTVVADSPSLFSAAYPGRCGDAVAALRGSSGPFPAGAIVWVDLRGAASRLLDGPPRGITVGR